MTTLLYCSSLTASSLLAVGATAEADASTQLEVVVQRRHIVGTISNIKPYKTSFKYERFELTASQAVRKVCSK